SIMLKFIRNKVQEKRLQELEKTFDRKVPEDIATNPDVVNLILKYLKDKENDEMLALIFIWNNAGFNDTMKGEAIGNWANNVETNLSWARKQAGVPNICHQLIRIGKISAHTANADVEDYLYVLK
ncbi:1589_t:CDS:2, partial [Entrophospora sp. SA101]